MFDVNPLGPMMHLKEIEREALALRAARVESRSGVLKNALAWVVIWLRRPSISLRVMKQADSANSNGI
jgi:hypothetical protein